MSTQANLSPADPAELEHALAHALRFDGRKQFRPSGEMMAKITAAHLLEQLKQAGYVVMKKPPAPRHVAPCYGPAGKPPGEDLIAEADV
jgi:hypothetical protein